MNIFYTFIFFIFAASTCITGNEAHTDSLKLNSPTFSEQILFVHYLTESDNEEDATFYLNQIDSNSLNIHSLDSLNYYKGWVRYRLKKLNTAAFYLCKVSDKSSLFVKSRYYAAICYAYLEDFEHSDSVLSTISDQGNDQLLNELFAFEKACLALLRNDINLYDSISASFTFSFYAFSEEEKNLPEYKESLLKIKHKSPFAAALFSGIIPGTGKIYSGKTGEGIGALLMVASVGALSAEGIIKDGIISPRSLIFTPLFALFYVGNIWGSYFSATRETHDKYEFIYQHILFDMHAALRKVHSH